MTIYERRDVLGPEPDPLGWEEAVEAVMRAADPELERRRSAAWILPDRWTRPVLAAAASLILLACGSLLWSSGQEGPFRGVTASSVAAMPGFEDVLYPPVVARWIGGQSEPTVEDFVFTAVDE